MGFIIGPRVGFYVTCRVLLPWEKMTRGEPFTFLPLLPPQQFSLNN